MGHLPFPVSRLLLFAHSKAESKQLWRPRSTSVKDRQSSKGQSGRTSSLDSESSPDSWHSTQVRPGAISPDCFLLRVPMGLLSQLPTAGAPYWA